MGQFLRPRVPWLGARVNLGADNVVRTEGVVERLLELLWSFFSDDFISIKHCENNVVTQISKDLMFTAQKFWCLAFTHSPSIIAIIFSQSRLLPPSRTCRLLLTCNTSILVLVVFMIAADIP